MKGVKKLSQNNNGCLLRLILRTNKGNERMDYVCKRSTFLEVVIGLLQRWFLDHLVLIIIIIIIKPLFKEGST